MIAATSTGLAVTEEPAKAGWRLGASCEALKLSHPANSTSGAAIGCAGFVMRVVIFEWSFCLNEAVVQRRGWRGIRSGLAPSKCGRLLSEAAPGAALGWRRASAL